MFIILAGFIRYSVVYSTVPFSQYGAALYSLHSSFLSIQAALCSLQSAHLPIRAALAHCTVSFSQYGPHYAHCTVRFSQYGPHCAHTQFASPNTGRTVLTAVEEHSAPTA